MRYPADHDPSLPVYLNSYGPEVLEEQSTNGFRDCGQPEKAVLILERRIKATPSDLHRDNGHLLAKLARAVVALPHPDPGRALTLGLRSAHEARSTASARISRELHGLDRIIQNRWPTLPGRQQLREALSALTMPAKRCLTRSA